MQYSNSNSSSNSSSCGSSIATTDEKCKIFPEERWNGIVPVKSNTSSLVIRLRMNYKSN